MDSVLNDFLKIKGFIKEEPKKVNKKVEKVEMPQLTLNINEITFKDIIEKKPKRKDVIEYIKNKMEGYEKEFLD